MKNKLLLFIVLIIVTNLTLANAFTINSNQIIQITKGASTFTFELKDVNGSTALLDKIHHHDKTGESATYTLWYNSSDCLIKTERGCHLQLINVYSSEDTGYAVLKDIDLNEEVTLSVKLGPLSINIYTFDEPPDIFWRVKQHLTGWYNCPGENSVSEIRNKINKLQIIRDRISDNDIQKLKEQCDNSNLFQIEGVETEGYIKECFNYLSTLLENDNLSAHKRWLLKECYVREYFNDRFNYEILPDYNATYFENRLNGRDIEFIDFIKYKYQYGSLGEVSEEESEATEKGLIEQKTLAAKAKEQKERESGDAEIATASYERKKVPTNLIEIIKEKIRNFLRWFS